MPADRYFGLGAFALVGIARQPPGRAQLRRYGDKIGQRARLHLAHHVGAMDLGGDLAGPDLSGDLLVHAAHHHQRHDGPLPRGQRFIALAQDGHLLLLLAPVAITMQSDLHRVEQVLLAERLGEELHRARLHGADRHRDIAVSGEKNDRQTDVGLVELALEVEPTLFRQAHVENEAARHFRLLALQHLACGAEEPGAQPDRFEKIVQGIPDRGIVVDHQNRGTLVFAHGCCPPANGSVKLSTAPYRAAASAHSRPPCASMMEVLIESPMPMPSGLVVKKVSKMRAAFSAARPVPESSTATRTVLPSNRSDRTTSVRGRSVTVAIASIAFMTRLRMTCSSWIRSPVIDGKPVSRWVATATCLLCNSPRRSARTSRMTPLIDNAVCVEVLLRMNERIRLMTSLARLASAMTRLTESLARRTFGGSPASQR